MENRRGSPDLEQKFYSELNPARILSGNDLSKRRRSQEVIGQIEIGVVQQIEKLGAELDREPLGQRSVFHDREIYRFQAGTIQNIPSGVSEMPVRRHRERGRVEPLRRQRIRELGIPCDVGPVIRTETERGLAGVGVVVVG